VPSGTGLSVKVAVAVSPEERPTAFRVNAVPTSSGEIMKLLSERFPELSAVAERICGPSWLGSSINVREIVSPARKPEPVTVT
jgi:hypothetical protein